VYIADEIKILKKYARINKILKKKSTEDIRICIWVIFERCKVVLGCHEIYLNMEDENNYLDEYLTFKRLNLKERNAHLIIKIKLY
jgi:hypothetical protein